MAGGCLSRPQALPAGGPYDPRVLRHYTEQGTVVAVKQVEGWLQVRASHQAALPVGAWLEFRSGAMLRVWLPAEQVQLMDLLDSGMCNELPQAGSDECRRLGLWQSDLPYPQDEGARLAVREWLDDRGRYWVRRQRAAARYHVSPDVEAEYPCWHLQLPDGGQISLLLMQEP